MEKVQDKKALGKIAQVLQRLDEGHYTSKDVIAIVADRLLKEIRKK